MGCPLRNVCEGSGGCPRYKLEAHTDDKGDCWAGVSSWLGALAVKFHALRLFLATNGCQEINSWRRANGKPTTPTNTLRKAVTAAARFLKENPIN